MHSGEKSKNSQWGKAKQMQQIRGLKKPPLRSLPSQSQAWCCIASHALEGPEIVD